MKKTSSIIAIKIIVICTLFCLLSAVAMPKLFNFNKRNAASTCKSNQIIIETALAIAYADSLAKGVDHFPEKLSKDMFENGIIPTCPFDGTPIQFDPKTGNAFCPNHIHSHARNSE